MGCVPLICGKQSYSYAKQQQLLRNVMSQFTHLSQCYSHDFVINCHKNMILKPDSFLLKYEKKIQQKQIVPHTILQKWKLILYGTNIDSEHYADCIGFDKHFQEQRIAQKTYRFSKSNPFEIRLQDLYFHQSYKQIQKDAGRVYLVPQIKQDLFQKLLKKIANHFPQSGYSLGINYIIGYFLLVGTSQMDSFWMFVHLALNEKFLALGFFQNDLPLTKIIIEIFKNILNRKNKQLYEYIYKHLKVDDASWILKWITSFYLSTFPIQFCHYILDYIFSFGILGLAVVAYSIVNYFQSYIFKCEDQGDFSQIIQQLFSFQHFSQEIQIQAFMSSIYDVSLNQRDFNFLSELGDNFYVKYFVLYSDWRFKNNIQCRQQMNELLSDWYESIINRRSSFTKLARSFDGKFLPQNQNKQNIEKSENISITDAKMDVTKQQKMQPKTFQHLDIPEDFQKNDEKFSQNKSKQKPQKAHTVKISSRHKKFSVESSQFQSSSVKEAYQIDFPIREKIKRPKSQISIQNKRSQKMRRIKSEKRIGVIVSKKQGQKTDKQFSQIESYVSQKKISEGQIQFNFRPLNKQFSHENNWSKTLPLRKNNYQLKSATFLQVKEVEKQLSVHDINIKSGQIKWNKNVQNNKEKQKQQEIKQGLKVEMNEIQSPIKDEQIQKIWNQSIIPQRQVNQIIESIQNKQIEQTNEIQLKINQLNQDKQIVSNNIKQEQQTKIIPQTVNKNIKQIVNQQKQYQQIQDKQIKQIEINHNQIQTYINNTIPSETVNQQIPFETVNQQIEQSIQQNYKIQQISISNVFIAQQY